MPDLPGCIAVGDALEETERLIREAIEFHIEGMRLNGEPVPEPTTRVELVAVGRWLCSGATWIGLCRLGAFYGISGS